MDQVEMHIPNNQTQVRWQIDGPCSRNNITQSIVDDAICNDGFCARDYGKPAKG